MAYTNEIRAMSSKEIIEAIDAAKAELFNLRFQWETGQLADPNRIRVLRRDIARYKTILRERELAEETIRQERKPNA